MNILVTGGLGFIGSNLIRELYAHGHTIYNVDRHSYAASDSNIGTHIAASPQYIYIQCDLRYMDIPVDIPPIDAIYHLAAESHVDRSINTPTIFIESNVLGTSRVLEYARRAGTPRIIVMGTDEEYGPASTDTGRFYESDRLRPKNPYAASKAASSLLALSYHNTYDLPVMVTRPCNNYGPRQHREKLIPTIITTLKLISDGENIHVPIYGDGGQIREWIYVRDCARALITVMEEGEVGEIYNIGTDRRHTNMEVVAYIHRLMCHMGVDLPPLDECVEHVEDRAGHDRMYAVNSWKLRELGWNAVAPLRASMEDTIRWYIGGHDGIL